MWDPLEPLLLSSPLPYSNNLQSIMFLVVLCVTAALAVLAVTVCRLQGWASMTLDRFGRILG